MHRWSGLLLFITLGILVLLAPPPAPELRGRVVGPDGPLAGALVRIQGSPVHTRSDATGAFALPAGRRITAWKEGFLISGTQASGRPLQLGLPPLPRHDHEGYAWVGPTPS